MAEFLDGAVIAGAEQKRARKDSVVRWSLAHQRAVDEGLLAYTVNGSPLLWAVTAGSVAGMVYSVEIIPGEHPICGCPAATKGQDTVCKHRALVLHRLGMLPVAPVAPANVVPIGGMSYAAAD